MIFGIVRLTDLNLAKPYYNQIPTKAGVCGRSVTPAPLFFYKILVKYGWWVLEYVVATSQEFEVPYTSLKEKISGIVYRDRDLINFAPISLKLINLKDNVCNNYLFVEPISYILTYSGNNLSEPTLEFSKFPSSISEPPLSPMTHDDYCFTISLNEFIRHTDMSLLSDMPVETHTLDLRKAMDGLMGTSSRNNDILDRVTINDIYMMEHMLNNTSPGGMQHIYPALRDHVRPLIELMPVDPVLRAFIRTPSTVRLSEIYPYIDMRNCEMYGSMARNYIDPVISPYPLDRSNKAFQDLLIDELVWDIQGAPIVDLNLSISVPERVQTNLATTWNGVADMGIDAGLKAYLARLHNQLARIYGTNNLSINLNKNWLDEISLEIVSNRGIELYTVPLWLYNLSSPCAINATVVSAVLAH